MFGGAAATGGGAELGGWLVGMGNGGGMVGRREAAEVVTVVACGFAADE
jgi:hypothetical protein